ncbi:MAG: single-stranded-DNA-specific exonuclease RecJ, partial [Coleofasciculus sp. C2-GNP5-27]
HVFEALQSCHDLLEKFGGHQAAGGFTLPSENLTAFQSQLSHFAHQCLEPEHLKPLVAIDAEANFNQISYNLYQQIDRLHPCGIGNPDPIFWTPNVRVVEQRLVGKGHLKLTLSGFDGTKQLKAIAWRWGEYFPLPSNVDIAYKLKDNAWNGNVTIELELVGIRVSESAPSSIKKAEFYHNERRYTCSLWESLNELRIRNAEGKVLVVQKGQRTGLLGFKRDDAKQVDVTQPHYYHLIKAATRALKL